jgi:hypothetical protein
MIFFLLVMLDAFGCFVVTHFSLIMLVLNIGLGELLSSVHQEL